MVLWLTQAAFSKDPDSVHIVAHKHLQLLVPEALTPGLGDAHDMYLKVSDPMAVVVHTGRGRGLSTERPYSKKLPGGGSGTCL